MSEGMNERSFVLTRDMVPIEVSPSGEGISFFCPMPKGSADILAKIENTAEKANVLKSEINSLVKNKKEPFENILLEYSRKSPELQKKLLEGFGIKNIETDKERGVYLICVGETGIVRRMAGCIDWYEHLTLCFARDLFEPNIGFWCDPVDHYGQALIGREFCVRYFNLLQSFKK